MKKDESFKAIVRLLYEYHKSTAQSRILQFVYPEHPYRSARVKPDRIMPPRIAQGESGIAANARFSITQYFPIQT